MPLWLAVTAGLWLALIAVQALVGPFDGYQPGHVAARGGLLCTGPLLAEALLHAARALLTPRPVLFCYSLLLVAVPIVSAWIIAHFVGKTEVLRTKRTRMLLLALMAAVTVLAFMDLPYLSNDIYLYRVHGQMLAEQAQNPYTVTPTQSFPPEALKNIPWTHQNSPYGPLALSIFAATDVFNGGIVLGFWLLKIALGLPLLVMLVYLCASKLFDRDQRTAWFFWVGLNPLLILEVWQNGHLEGWIGLLLFSLIIALLDVSRVRTARGGVLFGLACAVKLSVIVAAPVVLVWLASSRLGHRPAREAALRGALFLALMAVTLASLYGPFWQGMQTFAGIQQESHKAIRSLSWILAYYFGVSAMSVQAVSMAGNLAAALVGMLVVRKRKSLTEGLLATLLIQTFLGRTFLQPWHLCPLIMLAPLLGTRVLHYAGETSMLQQIGAPEADILRILLVLSASAVAGGYAVLYLAGGKSPEALLLSFLCMTIPPLLAWAWLAITPRRRTA